MITDKDGVNEQEEIMEKLNEKGKVAEEGASGIKTERFKALKSNYLKPNLALMDIDTKCNNGCSDMASGDWCPLHSMCGKIHCYDCPYYTPTPCHAPYG